MKVLIAILCFFIFTKIFLFWVWLWQLKEYHLKRFKAHFETQKLRKFLFSFYGFRYPKITLKTTFIILFGLVFEVFIIWEILFKNDSQVQIKPGIIILILGFIIFAPLFFSLLILVFQVFAYIMRRVVLKRARLKREKFKNLIVIGITGSYGKSSTKEFLATILSEKFNVLKTPKNNNAEIGIAKTILNDLTFEHQIFIAEIGAYERGKIKEVCQMLKPNIGILTGINEQHLSTFGSLENIKEAKFELIKFLPKSEWAFTFESIKNITEGEMVISKDNLILNAKEIKVEKEFFSFNINGVNFRLNLLGKHNINNILLAILCANKLKMSLEEISAACLKIKPEQGGMRILKKFPTIIDSSYSANPNSVISHLEYLKLYKGKKVIIMPCLIELGYLGRDIHKKIGEKIAQICDLGIITTKDYFKEIKNNNENILLLEKTKEIIYKIKEFKGEDDVIFLEGRVPKDLVKLLAKI